MDPGPPHKRRRPAVACTECRRRKISCDLASPCGPCSKSRSALKCVYNNDCNCSNNGRRNSIANSSANSNSNRNRNRNRNSNSSSNSSGDSSGDRNGNHGADRASSKPSESTTTSEAQPERPKSLDPMIETSSDHFIPFHDLTMFGEGLLNLDTISLDALASSHSDSNDNFFDPILDCSHRGLDSKLMTLSPILTATSFPSSSMSNSQMDMGTQPLLPPSTASSSTSLAKRLSTLEPGGNKFEFRPYNLHIRPEGVRSLLREVGDHTRDSHGQLPPGSESVESLMATLTKLEHTAREIHENKAACATWSPKNSAFQASSGWDMLPPRTQCDTLLDAYFKSFESVLRILHVPSFMQRYEQFWSRARSQGNIGDEAFVCTLLTAIALGSCVSLGPHLLDDSGRVLQEQAAGWIAYSRDFLSRKIAAGAHENFEIAQLMCLLTLARHTQAQFGDAASSRFMFGDDDLVRIGIRMRLYREPGTRGVHGSTKDVEMHRRLWATMLELSMQSCLAEGLPAPIAPDGYDCEPPSNIADESIEGGLDRQCLTPTTILRLLAKTQRLRLRILHLANTPRTPQTSQEAYVLGTELNEACNAHMHVLNAMKPAQTTEFQRKLLNMFTRSFILALHTSLFEGDRTDPAAYYSRRMRMETSMLLLCPSGSHDRSESPNLPNMQVSGLSAEEPTTNNGMCAFTGTSLHMAMGGPVNTTTSSASSAPASSDAYGSILVHSNSHGHFVRIQRQMISVLCLDLISELERNEFPILNQSSMHQIRDVLRVAMQTFENRMRSASGAHSAREFVIFAAASAYIDALLLGGPTGNPMQVGSRQQHNVDETTARAVLSALNTFTKVLHRDKAY